MSGSQNGRQFDKLNGEEGTQKWKMKLSKQFFRHFEQQPQALCNFKREFWRCFCDLRGNIFVIVQFIPAKEPAEV